jgi:hypothetical protein
VLAHTVPHTLPHALTPRPPYAHFSLFYTSSVSLFVRSRLSDDSKKELKRRAKKAKERIKYAENTKINKEDDTRADRKVVAENACNDASVNAVATGTTTDKTITQIHDDNKYTYNEAKPIRNKNDDENKLASTKMKAKVYVDMNGSPGTMPAPNVTAGAVNNTVNKHVGQHGGSVLLPSDRDDNKAEVKASRRAA